VNEPAPLVKRTTPLWAHVVACCVFYFAVGGLLTAVEVTLATRRRIAPVIAPALLGQWGGMRRILIGVGTLLGTADEHATIKLVRASSKSAPDC
jgi:hypothetical protein